MTKAFLMTVCSILSPAVWQGQGFPLHPRIG
jgi:hypothetical protein